MLTTRRAVSLVSRIAWRYSRCLVFTPMVTGPLPIFKPLRIPSNLLAPSDFTFSYARLELPLLRTRIKLIDVTKVHNFYWMQYQYFEI